MKRLSEIASLNMFCLFEHLSETLSICNKSRTTAISPLLAYQPTSGISTLEISIFLSLFG